MSDEHKGPCGDYSAVVDECDARGREIERLTRERDGFRESLAVVRVVLDGTTERLESVEEERDAIERKVEKLREALKPFSDEAQRYYRVVLGQDIDDWTLSSTTLTLGDLRRARAAMKETSDE